MPRPAARSRLTWSFSTARPARFSTRSKAARSWISERDALRSWDSLVKQPNSHRSFLVIASAAKQSTVRRNTKLDRVAALAMTADTHHSHRSSPLVMPGLVPGIHVLGPATKDVGGRDVGAKQSFVASPGHDGHMLAT